MRFASFAAAAALATVATAPAFADPTIANGFYVDRTFKVCSNKAFCEVEMTAVPAGKTLIITDAGCVVTTSGNIPLVSSVLRGRDSGGVLTSRNSYFEPLLTLNSGGDRRYQLQTKATNIALAGDKPQVFLGTLGTSSAFMADCTIAGLLK